MPGDDFRDETKFSLTVEHDGTERDSECDFALRMRGSGRPNSRRGAAEW